MCVCVLVGVPTCVCAAEQIYIMPDQNSHWMLFILMMRSDKCIIPGSCFTDYLSSHQLYVLLPHSLLHDRCFLAHLSKVCVCVCVCEYMYEVGGGGDGGGGGGEVVPMALARLLCSRLQSSEELGKLGLQFAGVPAMQLHAEL